ncbi:hypothetical protein [Phenylobacterium kunshanense]|uniref:hypothetical protein n=1 Tax=Phenylobacterium kunshanense TaxID=1445034 RepID=UPI00197B9F8E|nr:hypothetical protein [Phenylobacterium kunshanense]
MNRLFRIETGEWPKLLQFGLFGLLLQTGMGVGFAAGDAAFLSHVGPDRLPLIFLLTPGVMLVYTAVFSVLTVRLSPDQIVDVTLAALIAGGALLWAFIELSPPAWGGAPYYAFKLYLAMWYIGIYTLFWTFTDAYFDIQDAKRLFPLFAAFCALGTALGALIVSLFAGRLPMHGFLLVWSGLALLTAPVARRLRLRWRRLSDGEVDLDEEPASVGAQLAQVARTFRTSPYAAALALTMFVTLLLTNLAEYQYAVILEKGRSEAELAALFGRLYAAANVFNLVVCLFVFNRLVTRIGVRNVALILPATYFIVFAVFFLAGGTLAALAAFFAYHGVLTSIEYNNQNLLFNATPSDVRRPLRTVVEGMAEPLASLLAGGFLLTMATQVDMRELSGIGVLLGAVLIAIVLGLRHLYPQAMAANMRRGWLNFGELAARAPGPQRGPASDASHASADRIAEGLAGLDPSALKAAVGALRTAAGPGDIGVVTPLVSILPNLDREGRAAALEALARIGDVETIPQVLGAAPQLGPRDLRRLEALMVEFGEAAVPRLIQVLASPQASYRARSVAARALSDLSPAQFEAQLHPIANDELDEAGRSLYLAEHFESDAEPSPALALLAHAYRERVGQAVDFVLELLALGGRLPDFDLLVVSLHSANPKVRGNAIEAIASGVDHATWSRLDPLLNRRTASHQIHEPGDLVTRLEDAARSRRGFEALCAAQALRDRVAPREMPQRLRGAVSLETPSAIRESFAVLMGLDERPTLVDLVCAIRQRSDFAPASLDAQQALAERAAPDATGAGAIELRLQGRTWWLDAADVEDLAARYPDLALAMLKARDARSYAA